MNIKKKLYLKLKNKLVIDGTTHKGEWRLESHQFFEQKYTDKRKATKLLYGQIINDIIKIFKEEKNG